nr:helix-turn-helix domain-containing protein [Paracidovorax valerianellae]
MAWPWIKLHGSSRSTCWLRQARSSQRTLNRRFQEQLGMSPAQWLVRARVRRGQELLESTSLSIEQIVSKVGLGSSANFRAQFVRQVGVSPSEYRRSFGGRSFGASLA